MDAPPCAPRGLGSRPYVEASSWEPSCLHFRTSRGIRCDLRRELGDGPRDPGLERGQGDGEALCPLYRISRVNAVRQHAGPHLQESPGQERCRQRRLRVRENLKKRMCLRYNLIIVDSSVQTLFATLSRVGPSQWQLTSNVPLCFCNFARAI